MIQGQSDVGSTAQTMRAGHGKKAAVSGCELGLNPGGENAATSQGEGSVGVVFC